MLKEGIIKEGIIKEDNIEETPALKKYKEEK
jgi:hypothetical protein